MTFYKFAAPTNAKVIVTEVDTLPGFYAARQALASQQWATVICAVSNQSSELAQTIAKEGGQVVQYSLDNVETLNNLFTQGDALILTPPREENAVNKIKNVIKSLQDIGAPVVEHGEFFGAAMAEQEGIKSVVLVSCILAKYGTPGQGPFNNKTSPNQMAQQWSEIEEIVKSAIPSAPILRSALFMQFFFYLSEIIQNKGMIPLSFGTEGKFAPVNLNDVTLAANRVLVEQYSAITGGGSEDDLAPTKGGNNSFYKFFIADASSSTSGVNPDVPHFGQVYTLTGIELVTGPAIAQLASQALDAKIEYQTVQDTEMAKILAGTAQLSQLEIDDFLAAAQFIRDNKLNFVSKDLQNIIGKKPTTVKQFFQDNARQFAPKNPTPFF